ncbi:MAG TPA: MurR/RpiR family transcriptional regulator [Acidimicrobiales bacterium]|nr:MurR/RpiR family transcriptional regulator [Acidimicrobiales bacterium]
MDLRDAALRDVIAASADRLSPSERLVADAVAADPSAVAFGTVASVAERAGVSGPTVVRLAAKLGYDGFPGMQARVQEELANRLRPAAERIRQRESSDVLGRTLATSVANVTATLERADRKAFARSGELLADPKRTVFVLAGDATAGIASTVAADLHELRDAVVLLYGAPTTVARTMVDMTRGDVLLVIEVRRYERWVLDATADARSRGAHVIAVTDSLVSPLAEGAAATFVVDAEGAGPFDSHVATLALGGALVAEVATRRRRTATARLDRVEAAQAHLLS